MHVGIRQQRCSYSAGHNGRFRAAFDPSEDACVRCQVNMHTALAGFPLLAEEADRVLTQQNFSLRIQTTPYS